MLRKDSTLRWLLPAAFIILTILAPDGALACRAHRQVDPVLDPCDAPRDGAGIPYNDTTPQPALPFAPPLPAPVFRSAASPDRSAPNNLGVVADVVTPPPRTRF